MARELVTTEMEVEMNGETIVVDVWGYVYFSTDTTYGEDADGNRGSTKTEVEEVRDIEAYNIDGDPVKLNAKETEQASELIGTTFLEK